MSDEEPLVHICETCGVEKVMTPEEAYREGWDYPPRMGAFTVLSPRTCPTCPIDTTLWWKVAVKKEAMTEKGIALITRIQEEPFSIRPRN